MSVCMTVPVTRTGVFPWIELTAGDTYTFICSSHVITSTSRRGSNQHQQVEQGQCAHCGVAFERRVDWRRKTDTGWRLVDTNDARER